MPRFQGTNPEALGLAFHHHGLIFFNAYCQAATNLVNRDRGGSNDLPLPRKSALPEFFVQFSLK